MPASFDGVNKIITLQSGVTQVDAQDDLYEEWKTWAKLSDNLKFEPAFAESVGGNSLSGTLSLGAYFFVRNDLGWRIKPPEEDIVIEINGNLFVSDTGSPLYNTTTGNFNTSIRLNTSSLTQSAEFGSSEKSKLEELWKLSGLDSTNDLVVTSTTRTAGTGVSQSITESPPGTVTVSRT